LDKTRKFATIAAVILLVVKLYTAFVNYIIAKYLLSINTYIKRKRNTLKQ